MAKEILLWLLIPLIVTMIAFVIVSTAAIYLEAIRPYLAKMCEAWEAKGRERKRAKITGINFTVDIARDGQYNIPKDDVYRHQA